MTQKLLDGLQIMLVEEEALIAMDVEQLCYDHGAARVTTFNTLSEAAEHAHSADIDAAILDVKLHGESIVDLARALATRQIPFIFATGYTDAEPIFAEFPGTKIVPKPYSNLELAQAILEEMVGARSHERR